MKNGLYNKIISLMQKFFARVVLILTSCDKDKNNEESSKTESIDITKLPVFYNGVAMNCLLEEFMKPENRDGDMEEVCLVFEETLHVFDTDAIFYEFCDTAQILEIYETNKKLDLIHTKAVELGLTKLEDEFEYDDIPVEMAQYWEQVFRAPMPEPSRVWAGKLWENQRFSGSHYTFSPNFCTGFGDFNNRARSFQSYPHACVCCLCTKQWFGGDKFWYIYIDLPFEAPVLPSKLDKKLCSSFGIYSNNIWHLGKNNLSKERLCHRVRSLAEAIR